MQHENYTKDSMKLMDSIIVHFSCKATGRGRWTIFPIIWLVHIDVVAKGH